MSKAARTRGWTSPTAPSSTPATTIAAGRGGCSPAGPAPPGPPIGLTVAEATEVDGGRNHRADAVVAVVAADLLDDVDLGGGVEPPRWNRDVVVIADRGRRESDRFEKSRDLGRGDGG